VRQKVLQMFRRRVNVKLGRNRSTQVRDVRSPSVRTSLQFIIQNDRFSNVLHGLASLLALALQSPVGIFLADPQVALQDALSTVDNLAGFELVGKGGLFRLQEQPLAFLLLQVRN